MAEPVVAPGSLAGVAPLVRRFHDPTVGTSLAGDQEVVCHNDLSPKNTVYRATATGLCPAPASTMSRTCAGSIQTSDPSVRDATEAAGLLRLICDTDDGLGDRTAVIDTILWWQERRWRGIEAGADADDPAMTALRDAGVSRPVRTARQWLSDHRRALESRIR
jgi:hypothetical protein